MPLSTKLVRASSPVQLDACYITLRLGQYHLKYCATLDTIGANSCDLDEMAPSELALLRIGEGR